MVEKEVTYVTSIEAEALLGVKRESLYSYVSRNKINAIIDPKNKRKRLYSYDDIVKLVEKKKSLGAEKIAQNSLMWGEPVLESAITFINNSKLYYRGYPITMLVKQHSYVEVASLIWTGDFETAKNYFTEIVPTLHHINYSLSDVQEYLLQLEKRDRDTVSFFPHIELGAKILVSIVQDITQNFQKNIPIPAKLAGFFCPNKKHATELLETALIVIADHELNTSSFTARTVASTGANLFQVLVAGLSAMSGYKHGGAILRIEQMVKELKENMTFERDLRKREEYSESIVGFGHKLYPEGDPRAKILLDKIAKYYGDTKEYNIFKSIMVSCMERTKQKPTIDFALLTLASVLEVNSDFAQFLFGYGRIVGWIGQVLEEYQENRLIRPRAKYTGNMPVD